jgi:predicted nucleic acid-binding Zn ribbon protein
LLRLIDMTTEERAEQERRKELARAASQDGSLCGQCGRAIGADEAVWLVRIELISGATCAPICADCRGLHGDSAFGSDEMVACAGCGRPVGGNVWIVTGEDASPDRRFCSGACGAVAAA